MEEGEYKSTGKEIILYKKLVEDLDLNIDKVKEHPVFQCMGMTLRFKHVNDNADWVCNKLEPKE